MSNQRFSPEFKDEAVRQIVDRKELQMVLPLNKNISGSYG